MPIKIEIFGNAIVVTDTISTDILVDQPAKEVYYTSRLLDQEIIHLTILDGSRERLIGLLTISLSEAVDSGDSSFTKASWQTFARNNLGSSGAGGGGGGSGSIRLVKLGGATISSDRATLNFSNTSTINFTVTDNAGSDAADVIANIVNDSDSSTGLMNGGVLSTGAGSDEYSISDGEGVVVTATGAKTFVSWSGQINRVPVDIATQNITFVGINSSGAVIEQSGRFTSLQQRTIIVLGVIVHVNRVDVDTVNNEQEVTYNIKNQLFDLANAISFFNVSGNVFGPNGANLTINKTDGVMFKMGSNYSNDTQDPNNLELALLTAPEFQYRFSDGSNGVTGTDIDSDNLDDGSGGTTSMTNNRWSVQRIYSFTSNNVKIQRGVTEYTNKESAIDGIVTEPYITEPSIAANGLFRGWLVVQVGATDLSNLSNTQFIEAPKFGEGSGTVGGGGGVVDDIFTINFIIDGGGSTITTGIKGQVVVDFNCEVIEWAIIGLPVGAIAVDVSRSTFAGFPTTSSIAGTELPTIVATNDTGEDRTIATWSTINTGDILEFKVDSVATIERCTVALKCRKTG